MRSAWAALVVAVIALFAGIWIGGHPDDLPSSIRDAFVESGTVSDGGVTAEAADLIEQKYFRRVSDQKLTDSSIQGMVEHLRETHHDRFSHYFTPKQASQFQESISGHFSGVGMTVGSVGKRGLRVGFVFRGSPAKKAGFKPGDFIVSVDGESIRGESAQLAVAKIKGPAGTKVTLGRQARGKGAVKQVELVRADIDVPITATRTREVDGAELGYVQLTTFSSGAGKKLRHAVKKVTGEGAEGIVLDLRGNGGGLLPEAVLTSSVFLPKGQVVVRTESRSEGDATYRAVGHNLPKVPMVVLVNRDTASAAEILTAALQTDADVPVVGTRTFGKGVFQQVMALDNGGSLDLTIGEFLTARGVSLAGKGIQPDVKVPAAADTHSEKALDRAFGVLRGELGE